MIRTASWIKRFALNAAKKSQLKLLGFALKPSATVKRQGVLILDAKNAEESTANNECSKDGLRQKEEPQSVLQHTGIGKGLVAAKRKETA